MYGLPQVGIIAQELLAQRLKGHSYIQSKSTPGLWMHEWCPITFSLLINNFGATCIREDHAQHLLQTVQKYYTCLFEKEGERYCRLTIKWDYANQKVHLSKPPYVMNALKHFQHPPPIVLQDQRTHTSKRHMARKYHMPIYPTTPHPLIKQERNLFRRSWGYFFILRELLI